MGMRELEECIVCEGASFEGLHEATFRGTWEQAVPYFLTDRQKAVHGNIVRCRQCGFVFANPQFEGADYARIYGRIPAVVPPGAQGRQRAAVARFRRLRERVLGHRESGRFLDLGCADGGFLKAMTGFDGVGFEVRGGDFGGETRGGDIVTGDFLEYCRDFPDRSDRPFDFVTAWDVFEHLPDLEDYLVAVRSILKDQGFLLCTLPDISSLAARISGRRWNCILLEHLWYFTPETFRRFVGRAGFEVVKVGPFRYAVDLRTLLLRMAQTYGGKPSRLPSFLADVVVELPIGLMFAACRVKV